MSLGRRDRSTYLLIIFKKWSTSVKILYFIAEPHDYFTQRFSNLHNDAPRPKVTSSAPHTQSPPVDHADEWCLKYLSVFYILSLSEVFDEDANGLISVREVNAFTSAILPGLSVPQALAYWAAGEYFGHCRQVELGAFTSAKVGEWIANITTHELNKSCTAWFMRKQTYCR